MNTSIDLDNINETFSNFQIFGFGKPSDAQLKRRKKVKDQIENLKDQAKDTIDRVKDGKISKDDWKSISNKWNKFNPAATVPRAAGLGLVRINFLGIARKLYAGLLSEAELKAKNYDLANAAILRNLWDTKLKDHWEALGGDISSLKKAVKQGFDKPIFKTKKVKAAKAKEQGISNACGEEISKLSDFNKWANEFDLSVADRDTALPIEKEYLNACEASCIAALIAAGGGIVVAAINATAKKAGAKDDPFVGGKTNDPELGMPPFTQMDEDALKAIELAALEDRRKHGLDADTYEAEYKAIEKKYDSIWGLPKGFVIGGGIVLGALAIWGGYLLYTKNKK